MPKFTCLHPNCSKVCKTKGGRNFHFSTHDDSKEVALKLLSKEDNIKYENCTDVVGLSAAFYENNFGSWNEALKLSGKETNREYDVSDEDLIKEIKRMSDDTPVRYHEMNNCGKYSARLYEIRFGSWNDALRKAGKNVWDRTGENNPSWKGGHDKYRGESWTNSRGKVYERAKGICEHPKCDKSEDLIGKELDVHHIVPFRYYESHEKANDVDNLIVLCPEHHKEEESRIWRIESNQNH